MQTADHCPDQVHHSCCKPLATCQDQLSLSRSKSSTSYSSAHICCSSPPPVLAEDKVCPSSPPDRWAPPSCLQHRQKSCSPSKHTSFDCPATCVGSTTNLVSANKELKRICKNHHHRHHDHYQTPVTTARHPVPVMSRLACVPPFSATALKDRNFQPGAVSHIPGAHVSHVLAMPPSELFDSTFPIINLSIYFTGVSFMGCGMGWH